MTPEQDEIRFSSNCFVDLDDYMGTDQAICRAARVSIQGADVFTGEGTVEDRDKGLINYLMKSRHGTPFEHAALKFTVEAPLFVFREFQRHRIGFSYNEMSGRYTEMRPKFFLPRATRNLVQVGKPGHYRFEPGTVEQAEHVSLTFRGSARADWNHYQGLLKAGVAKEVARMYLPLALYSAMYVTCNPRSLMHFLGLRTINDRAMFPSTPMQEIREVADAMEFEFKAKFPWTWEAFDNNGRVAP